MNIDRRRFAGALAGMGISLAALPRWTRAGANGARIRAMLQSHVDRGYATGAVALIGHGDEAEVIAVGRQGKHAARPMQRDSIFRIASMTKPIVGAATLMLVEDRKLTLNDSVERWLPELANRRVLRSLESALDDTVPARRAITVEDLLNFTFGMGIILAPPGTYPIQRRIEELKLPGFSAPDPNSPYTPDQWMGKLSELPLMAQPGERWMYNTGSYVLGVLIARVSGLSLPAFLDERVFAPLGMKDTGFFVPTAKLERLVDAHRHNGGELERYDAAPNSAWSRMPAFPDGGAGLVSTVDDYFAFSRLLLNGGRAGTRQLLSAASVAAMTKDHVTAQQRAGARPILDDHSGWGLGLSVVNRVTPQGIPVGGYGWIGGLGSAWMSEPRKRITSILTLQTVFESPEPPAAYTEFWHAVFAPAAS
ncbi:MAG: serine hydrolase domain-containing protein [Steroidobacteraceae bacterium]